MQLLIRAPAGHVPIAEAATATLEWAGAEDRIRAATPWARAALAAAALLAAVAPAVLRDLSPHGAARNEIWTVTVQIVLGLARLDADTRLTSIARLRKPCIRGRPLRPADGLLYPRTTPSRQKPWSAAPIRCDGEAGALPWISPDSRDGSPGRVANRHGMQEWHVCRRGYSSRN
ncbi:hypothetical protein [Streptomyces mangrovi]|uniref:hypothetical protein n=1 Tax=Streptomyces mangrovi TaxID=1206892 RepID=UPI0036D29913